MSEVEISAAEVRRPSSRGEREAEMVDEILALRAAGRLDLAKTRTEELLKSVRPVIIKAVRRVAARAGSLSEQDLEQVGAIEMIKTIDKFDVSKVKSQRFGHVVFFRVLRVLNEQIRLHGTDVHLSDGAARGRTVRQAKGKVEVSVQITSRDAQPPRRDDDERPVQVMPHEQHDETPEQMLGNAQQRQKIANALKSLSKEEQALVKMHFGIGWQHERSVRSIADEWFWSKSRADRLLKEALEKLKAMLNDEE